MMDGLRMRGHPYPRCAGRRACVCAALRAGPALPRPVRLVQTSLASAQAGVGGCMYVARPQQLLRPPSQATLALTRTISCTDPVIMVYPHARTNSFFAYAVWFGMFLLKKAYAFICWLFRAILWSCCWQKCVGLLLEVQKYVCFVVRAIWGIPYTFMHMHHTHIHICTDIIHIYIHIYSMYT